MFNFVIQGGYAVTTVFLSVAQTLSHPPENI